jgi:hypothetical protein
MDTLPFVLMLSVNLFVTGITGYFFIKVLRTPPKQS